MVSESEKKKKKKRQSKSTVVREMLEHVWNEEKREKVLMHFHMNEWQVGKYWGTNKKKAKETGKK